MHDGLKISSNSSNTIAAHMIGLIPMAKSVTQNKSAGGLVWERH